MGGREERGREGEERGKGREGEGEIEIGEIKIKIKRVIRKETSGADGNIV